MGTPAAGGLKTRFKPPFKEINSNNIASAEDLRQILKKKTYRIWPIVISKYLREDKKISMSAKICWQILYELAFFSDNLSLQISKAEMAYRLGRSSSTIGRIFNQLEKNHYIIRTVDKDEGNQPAHIKVRFPAEAIQKSSRQPDRRASSHAKTDNPSIYRLNINNNKTDPVEATPKVAIAESNPIVVDNAQMIEELERQYSENKKRINDLCTESVKHPKNPNEFYDRLKILYEKESAITAKIKQIKDKTVKKMIDHINSSGKRIIEKTAKQKLLSATKSRKDSIKIQQEIGWSVRFGELVYGLDGKERSVDHAIAVALKLVREGRWQTPARMPHG